MPLFITEQLGLEQGFRNGGTVDGNKLFIGAFGIVMNETGKDFLTGTGRPGQQHAGLGRRNLFCHFEDVFGFLVTINKRMVFAGCRG